MMSTVRGRLVGTGTVVAVLLLLLAGCASTGSKGDSSGDRDVLTREEIQAAGASNLYDVVQRRRPGWLRVRGGAGGIESGGAKIVVIRNGTRIGQAEILRQISPEGVSRLLYKKGETAASTLVGGREGFVEAAIIIETSR